MSNPTLVEIQVYKELLETQRAEFEHSRQAFDRYYQNRNFFIVIIAFLTPVITYMYGNSLTDIIAPIVGPKILLKPIMAFFIIAVFIFWMISIITNFIPKIILFRKRFYEKIEEKNVKLGAKEKKRRRIKAMDVGYMSQKPTEIEPDLRAYSRKPITLYIDLIKLYRENCIINWSMYALLKKYTYVTVYAIIATAFFSLSIMVLHFLCIVF
ncbi:MAG: hypothetical protein ACTSRW_04025 [Candidatus Helarchaeota archaeon]